MFCYYAKLCLNLKVIELDAQPNNVNKEISGLGPRSKTTLVGDYHYSRRNNDQHQYMNGNAASSSTFVPLPSASMRDLTMGRTPVIPGPGADVLFGDKAAQTVENGIANNNHINNNVDGLVSYLA